MAKIIFAQNPEKYIPALAEALKKVPEFEVPDWAMYVKTGVSRERPPMMEDFWYTRAASILRQLYIRGVVGVGKLRTRYGSRKDRGGKPDKFFKSGGKIIRVILQQAEAAGLVEKILRRQHGRRLTQSGRDFLDSIDAPYDNESDSDGWVVKPVVVEDVDEEDAGEGENLNTDNTDSVEEIKEDVEKGEGENGTQTNTDDTDNEKEEVKIENKDEDVKDGK